MEEVEQRFLDAIRRNPDDDDARMVYADWLEERGDPRGEYLRLEVQLYRLPGRIATLQALLDGEWLASIGRKFRLMLGDSHQKINSIKVIRELTGCGLKEAKDLCESGSRARPVQVRADLSFREAQEMAARFKGYAQVAIEPYAANSEVRSQVREVTLTAVLTSVDSDRLIEAITLVRDHTGLGLAAARDLVRGVEQGAPTTLREGLTSPDAQVLVRAFAGVGEIRLDP